jgi:hypothetical protein
VSTLIKQLENIAHLPTDVTFDSQKVLDELLALPYEMNPFKSGFRFERQMKIHDDDANWDSVALYSISGDVYSDPEEPWTGDFKPTPAIEKCPYLKSFIESFGGGKLLARFENIKPKHSVGWHGHVKEAGQPEWISVYQMPLSIPEGSKYSVINYMEYRLSDHCSAIPQYDEKYEDGRLYIFNSYHYHNAFNYSDKPMYMIRFYVDTREESVKQFLETQIKGYSGSFIPTYDEYMESFLTK